MESLFSSMLMPLLTLYLLHCCGEDWRKNRTLYLTGGVWFLYVILLVITQFTTKIYYFTDNVYHRGVWYPVLLVPPAFLMIMNLIVLFRKRKLLSRQNKCALMIYLLIPLFCILVQMWFYGLLLIAIGTSLAALIMFLFILMEQMDWYVLQKEEIANQKANIRVLQMRPHFIYNTMTSIYYLCQKNPEKAQQAILDFNSYLRKNMTAIVKAESIPFAEELEHARAYLAIEKLRFDDNLHVEYHTPHTFFRVPPLTLQPIVENAVKHGVDPELQPLHISISTERTKTGSKIIVVDDGPGFLESDIDSPHIALANIDERIKQMCGGSIAILSGKNGGTTVILEIPDKKVK